VFTIVLLTEHALTDHDVARVAHLHDPEPVQVHVLVPVEAERNRIVEALDEIALGQLREAVTESGQPPEQAHVAAENALARSLSALRLAGVTAEGELVRADPVRATAARAQELDADEVIVLTPPHFVEETFHRDWASRLRSTLRRPVLHVVAGTDRVQ
jgi:hypothetical protein